MKHIIIKFFIICISFFMLSPAYAENIEIDIIRVVDGDTLHAVDSTGKTFKIRLYGVDCPEMKQAYGPEARGFVIGLMLQKKAVFIPYSVDKYRRTTAVIEFVEVGTLQNLLVSNGYAWVDDRYCKRAECAGLRIKQETARQNKVGLWKDKNPIEPRQFRKGVR